MFLSTTNEADVYKQVLPPLLILTSLFLATTALATEPYGRVAFQTSWLNVKDGEPPRLQLTMTAVTALADARLVAKIPDGIGLSMRNENAVTIWPVEGIAIGSLGAGQSVAVEFDVTKPDHGGGIVSFTLEGTFQGRAVIEGVGVPVGVPGTEPTLRNGAVEFPALKLDGKR